MAFKTLLKTIGSMFGETIIDELKEKVDESIEDVKVKVEKTTELILKRLVSFFLIFIGVIFGLAGLGKFLSKTVPAFGNGIGYIVVGLLAILLGWFANYLSKN